ncbi:ubiquinone biosynthesis regulatory protein kinase UbiB [Coxiella burnetii]|uniref:ubiquinone biosynthesis regulatory protein kinase UbiB n=1 Tax=Coxiella burnetii TaxID=777 RepID=UPI00222EA06F|nr:ubiquinone biosynthesis regulatory protein kinase UbiB [Coxiella burnetii]
MRRLFQLIRLIQINFILLRHGFNRPVIGELSPSLRLLSYLNPWSFIQKDKSRGESFRIVLEELGPIFVKFGQLLSTRRDLLPDDIAEELEKLQDRVPPFPGKIAKAMIEKSCGKTIEDCFATFDETPLASASIAQVHAATLHDSSEVIIKVLRPNIAKTIQRDIALMYLGAKLARRFWRHGKRLKPVEVVAEFEHTIYHELDLMREAANASQLRRNFADSEKMYVPKIYWDYVHRDVMVMERIYGIRISNIAELKAANTNLKKLAEYGVEIFFTQVLRDSFFHADMHPGNLFVDVTDPENPKYLGVDFGIMGALSPQDQRYIAENLLAFFKRDYRQVAILHIESGWISADSRIDQFEAAIRTVCEPIFERPLKDISFGKLLLRLFQTADQFNMEIQPQLLLLQKTLLNIEGLGRQLYPDLDLWRTAKPFIEDWMRKQHGPRYLLNTAIKEFPLAVKTTLKLPRLLHDVLHEIHFRQNLERNEPHPPRKKQKRGFILGAGLAFLISALVSFLIAPTPPSPWQWTALGGGILLIIIGWLTPKD